MTAEVVASGISLTGFEKEKLLAVVGSKGIERIAGIPDLAAALRALMEDEHGNVVLDPKYATVTRSVVMHGLRSENEYVEGLCESGQAGAALQRLDSEHGPHAFLGMLSKVAAVEPLVPSGQKLGSDWA